MASKKVKEHEFYSLKMEFSPITLLILYVSKSSFSTVNVYLCTLFLVYVSFVFVDSVIAGEMKCFENTLILVGSFYFQGGNL